ncbi:hypothetical protein ACHHYP_15730 [Achlya hypogyna]|uniref:Prolyl 4-hydroxylase alpha subunit domain-containing protein n=1 Tax=Achlya hypogyna TaxID=1202772 RepID=A0A1V9YAB0_ACHHY|nr:hypothetical protein ACHHYP_15730 [Achlya hypogyna]
METPKKGSRWSHRRNERQKTFYHINNGLIADKSELSAAEITAYAEHTRNKCIAQFGVVKLAKYNLDVCCETYQGVMPLVRYAALHSPNIALALVYAGADPSFAKRHNGAVDSFPAAREILMKYPPPYMAWLLVLLATAPRTDSACGDCACVGSNMVLTPCDHAVCELCFWKHLATMRVDQDMTCSCCDVQLVLPCVKSPPAPPSPPSPMEPEDIAVASKAAYALLPPEPRKGSTNAKVSKLVKPLPLHNAVELFVGASQSQRDANMFKAVLADNCSRLRALVAAGADVDCANEYGQTPLFVAAWLGRDRVVAFLISVGASAVAQDNAGTLPVEAAAAHCHTGVVSLLQSPVGLCDFNPRWCPADEVPSPAFVELIPADASHPGAGSGYWDDLFPESFLARLEHLHSTLPVAPKEKASCSNRSYFCDSIGTVMNAVEARCGRRLFPNMRFLHYESIGGYLPAHTDLSRTDADGVTSTTTFILYLTSCSSGGETNLLSSMAPDRSVLAPVKPKRGRLLIFPHICPHEGGRVESVPKLLLRGEMY